MRNESTESNMGHNGVLPDLVPLEGVEILPPMGSEDLSEVSHGGEIEGDLRVLSDLVPLEGVEILSPIVSEDLSGYLMREKLGFH